MRENRQAGGFQFLNLNPGAEKAPPEDYPWAIKPWWGEFRNPVYEQAFLRQHAPLMAAQMQLALLVWALLMLLFAVPDYLALGSSREFYYLLCMRLATCTMLAGLFVAVGFRQSLAVQVAQRFIDTLAATPIDIGDQSIRVTATVGVVARMADETTMDALIQRADAALYQGKNAGRNQVMPG